jgi:hypothetical protein
MTSAILLPRQGAVQMPFRDTLGSRRVSLFFAFAQLIPGPKKLSYRSGDFFQQTFAFAPA